MSPSSGRIEAAIHRFTAFVTTYNKTVILAVLVVTGVLVVGMTQGAGQAQADTDEQIIEGTEVHEGLAYLETNYDVAGENTTTASIYVLDDDQSVLTADALLQALDYQQQVSESSAVADVLADDAFSGPPTVIGTELADESNPDIQEQYEAIDAASDEELEAAIERTLSDGELSQYYLPAEYSPGSTDAEGMRFTIELDPDVEIGFGVESPHESVTVLDETTEEFDEPSMVFLDGPETIAELNNDYLMDMVWLVIPLILVVLVVVLGFAYRDITDVVIGLIGTTLALVWTFGLMGWLGIMNTDTAIIAPVLVAALSIDFGFHIFMRYREQRGPEEGIRAALARSTGAVAIAFLLVTVTAAVGFLSNLTNPVAVIRDVSIAITLGVLSAFVLFTTVVPALKVSADGLWERFGFDRRGTPLGKGAYLKRVLGSSVTAAQRAGVVIIAVALIAGVAGGLLFFELDREQFQESDITEDPGWQSELPGPMAYETHESELANHFTYIDNEFQPDDQTAIEGGSGMTQILIYGDDVATAEAMETLAVGHEAANDADSDILSSQGGEVPAQSPLTLIQELAAQNDKIAEKLDQADTTGDDIPDNNIEPLLDAVSEAAPEESAHLLEQGNDGYDSMVLLVPVTESMGSDRADEMFGIAEEMDETSSHTVTPVGQGTISEVTLQEITDGIILTMFLAFAGVLLVLVLVYRHLRGTATLGAVTMIPIALTLGLVFAGMYALGEPITPLSALLVSILIGLGIDYNIHISDRFAHELRRTDDTQEALRETVTGTGGALLGSAVTSVSAFALIIVIPDAQLSSFGIVVALALGASFLMSVVVLPSLLYKWATYTSKSQQITAD